MTYDEVYSEADNIFGSSAERTLKNFVSQINKNYPVLDIGAGQGRNSLFLAERGFTVDALEPSKVAIETIKNKLGDKNYNIRMYQNEFQDFEPKNLPYSAVLIYGLIQILNWSTINLLFEKVEKWITKGSLVFITAFSSKDSSFRKFNNEWNKVGKNSFINKDGSYRTFLEPNEILNFFKDYRVLYHWEGLGPKHKHGHGPVEQHELIELVAKKI
jgi:cyclopropane fatty-acyl-phospholipid synthase-like methyltransferase